MSVPRAGSRSQRVFTFLSPSLPRASSVGMGRRGDFEKGNSYTLKLAQTGLGCLSIPDLFHLSHDLAKGYSLAIFGRLRQAMQALAQAKQRLESLHNSQADRAQVEQAQAL